MSDQYWNLTELERAKLPESEVDRMTKLALMEEGIVTPKKPEYVEPPDDPQIESQEFWKVTEKNGPESWRGTTTITCLFPTREAAEKAVALLQESGVKEDHDYQVDCDVAKPLGELALEKCRAWPAEAVELKRSILEKIKEAKESNETMRRKYDEELGKCKQATSKIYDDWYEQQDTMRTCQRIVEVFDDYRATVGKVPNQDEIALSFLRKAYDDDQIAKAAEWTGDARVALETEAPA